MTQRKKKRDLERLAHIIEAYVSGMDTRVVCSIFNITEPSLMRLMALYHPHATYEFAFELSHQSKMNDETVGGFAPLPTGDKPQAK